MSRQARIDYEGARHHVVNRGARRATIFPDADCLEQFLRLLGGLPQRYGVAIHAFTLMPNHFHLLLESHRARLSTAMAYLQSRYSYWLNRRYEWDGPVFRGRFHNRVVESGDYWRHLFGYIHLNPVRAHLAAIPDKSSWTTHSIYVGFQPRPAWLTTDGFRESFGTVTAYRDYIHALQLGSERVPEGFDPDEIWEGPDTGIVKLHLNAPEGAESKVPLLDVSTDEARIEQALGEMERIIGSPRRELLTSAIGRKGNRARWVAAWWLTRWGRITGVQAARVLGIRPSGVCQMATKATNSRESDAQIDTWMTALEDIGR